MSFRVIPERYRRHADGAGLEELRGLDAEIEHHLESIENEYIATGVDPARARSLALERFGDPTEARYGVVREMMGERSRRPRRGRGIIVGLSAACLSIAGWTVIRQSASADRISSLDTELADARSQLAAVRAGRLPALAQNVSFITVEGDVARPSLWTIPRGGHVTLREILGRCGGLGSGDVGAGGTITVTELRDEEPAEVRVFRLSELNMPGAEDPLLDGFFHIMVSNDDAGPARPGSSRPPASRG